MMKKITYSSICLFLLLTSLCSGQDMYSWSGFSQQIDVSIYAGKKFKLEAAVKSDCKMEKSMCGLWARIDKKDKSVGFFDNMMDRPIRDNEWKTYSIQGVVDDNANMLFIGGLVFYGGNFYFDDFKLSVLENEKWKSIEIKNSNFENNKMEDEMILGWKKLGKDVGKKKNHFIFSNSSKAVFQGKNALKVEGVNFIESRKILKKFEGEWSVKTIDSLCENTAKGYSSEGLYTYELLAGGLGLKETFIGVERYGGKEKSFDSNGFTTYHPALNEIYSIGYSTDYDPIIFRGVLHKNGNIFFENVGEKGAFAYSSKTVNINWINDNEFATIVKTIYPQRVIKIYYQSIRKK